MTQEERLLELEQYLQQHPRISLDEICQQYGISSDTARRDLIKLTQLPGIIRIRGGAMRSDNQLIPMPYLERELDSPVKQALGRMAASLIQPQDTVLLDTGTSIATMINYLKPPLHVVTNSVDIFSRLSHSPVIQLSLLGGHFDPDSRAILGDESIQQLQHYHVTKAFIGICALSEHGLSTANAAEAAIKKAMMQRAGKVILVGESSKMNQQLFFQIGHWSLIDCLITDKIPPDEILTAIHANDIELVVVPTGELS